MSSMGCGDSRASDQPAEKPEKTVSIRDPFLSASAHRFTPGQAIGLGPNRRQRPRSLSCFPGDGVKREVLCFGHPLLDIISMVDNDFLNKYKVAPGSISLADPAQMGIFSELRARSDVKFLAGGGSMNSCRVCRWIMQRDACGFVGALGGKDDFGRLLEEALEEAEVASYFQYVDEGTGTCAVMVVDRERALVANIGAAMALSMDHMESLLVRRMINDAQFFYAEGFFMNVESAPQSTVFVGKHCVEFNKTFLFNLSAPYLCEFKKQELAAIMPYVDFLFGNHQDAVSYAASIGWETSNMDEVLVKIAQLPKENKLRPRTVVITNGSETTTIAHSDGRVEHFAPLLVPVQEIVDTNGAGDGFVGGFLSQLAEGKDLEECVRVGHEAATVIIKTNGCTVPKDPPTFV